MNLTVMLIILMNLTVMLMILMNLTVILMILMNLVMILIIVRDKKKWVENSATGALAVTRDHPDGIRREHPDIRIVMKCPRIRISGCHPRMSSGYRYPW